jgi:hypothetical protein
LIGFNSGEGTVAEAKGLSLGDRMIEIAQENSEEAGTNA